jgi:hypothetical protein
MLFPSTSTKHHVQSLATQNLMSFTPLNTLNTPKMTTSRRRRKGKSTLVEHGAFGGIGGRRGQTMNARLADDLLRRRAPELTFKCQRGRIPDVAPNVAAGLDFLEIPEDGNTAADTSLLNLIHKKKRSRVGERKKLSENWVETEAMMVELLRRGPSRLVCTCARKFSVQVRILSLDSWSLKTINYCNCALSTVELVREGFFPATPRKPRTAFSVRMLQVLHEQSVRGAISKTAWAEGLRVAYEYEHRTTLPNFTRAVSVFMDTTFYCGVLITPPVERCVPPLSQC